MSFVALHSNARGVSEFVAEEIVAFVVVFRADAQKAGERVGEPSRGDGTKLRFLDALPKFGVLFAELRCSIDKEGYINSGMIYIYTVTEESALLGFVNHFAVIREIKHKSALRRVVLYHLLQKMVSVAQRVEISRFLAFRIVCETFLHILGFEEVERFRVATIVCLVAPHKVNDSKTWGRECVREHRGDETIVNGAFCQVVHKSRGGYERVGRRGEYAFNAGVVGEILVRNPFRFEIRSFERGGEIGKVVPFFSWFTVPKSEDALS